MEDGKLMADKFKEDAFYEHEESEQILCGECVTNDIKNGEIKAAEFRYLKDQDFEPYQCDGCNKQNDAYNIEYGDDE
jgi:hypothetical protein